MTSDDFGSLAGGIFVIVFLILASWGITYTAVNTSDYNVVYNNAHTICANKSDANACNQDIVMLKKISPDSDSKDIEVLKLLEQSAK